MPPNSVVSSAFSSVKHDCVFGDDLNLDEISIVSEVRTKPFSRVIFCYFPVCSVSPV